MMTSGGSDLLPMMTVPIFAMTTMVPTFAMMTMVPTFAR
jgi:hypothetical protein